MIDLAYTQHRGNKPRQQDALWAGERVLQENDLPVQGREVALDPCLTVAVADGLSGTTLPHLASRVALEALDAEIRGGAMLSSASLRRVHGRLCDRLATGRGRGGATTIAAVTCWVDRCVALSVGDSRVYRISAQGGWQQLTRDHTVRNNMIDAGLADEQTEYATLYDCLDGYLTADSQETDFPVCRVEAPISQGDAILVCTDGVHNCLGEQQLGQLTALPLAAATQLEILRKAILDAGAPDNFSMVMLVRRE